MTLNHTCVSRLNRELRMILKEPIPHIKALPNPKNILEWHYVISGPKGTPYEGGTYHGKVVFPTDYPHKPPSIFMLTPNGRFEIDKRLCLSMSDYHPESWNPLWSVASILNGLLSFMLEDQHTLGSINTSTDEKKRLASLSQRNNRKNPMFKKLFPDLVGSDKDDEKEEKKEGLITTRKEARKEQQNSSNVFLLVAFIIFALFVNHILKPNKEKE
eukprot:TRINITY_DN3028_c0_g1_i1.p1 TRINITY_DN3028_c0_g1~~TRINITY_DN3028_c0_g1_i1.p1  ORF type:complete len:231 (+),score=58.94 TRINITY_DN3028_c0_g1_i1:50-694(+)